MNDCNNNEKSPKEKFHTWITTVSSIFAILGISVVGIISFLNSKPDQTKESLQAYSSNENDQSESSIVEATDAPVTEPNTTLVPNPVPVPTAEPAPQPSIQPTMCPLSTPEVTSEIELQGISENPGFEQFQPKNDPGSGEQETSDNNNATYNSPKSFTQDNNDLNETNESTTNTLCQFEFKSPGRFVLTSKSGNSSNADGTIDIKNISEDAGDGQGLLSYKYSDLVNNEESSKEMTSFISVTQGAYIVHFVNCSINNVNFYFENSDDASSNNNENTTEESYEQIVVPSNEYTKVEISKENPSKTFKVSFAQGFKPLINFCSDHTTENNLVLKILDENMSELRHLELNNTNPDGSHDVSADFSFDAGKAYYIQISSVDNVELTQTCYFMITQIVEEESLETNNQ